MDLRIEAVRNDQRVSNDNYVHLVPGLLQEVWTYQPEVVTRTVDIHVAELRRKLEADAANPRHIITVFKVGYRLQR